MFGLNWSNPETLWLNVTNFALGVVVFLCLGLIGYGLLRDLLPRLRGVAVPDVKRLAGMDDHAFDIQGVGLTMADGGEPEKPKKPRK